MQCWRALTRAKQLSTAATSLAPKLHMRSWVVYSLHSLEYPKHSDYLKLSCNVRRDTLRSSLQKIGNSDRLMLANAVFDKTCSSPSEHSSLALSVEQGVDPDVTGGRGGGGEVDSTTFFTVIDRKADHDSCFLLNMRTRHLLGLNFICPLLIPARVSSKCSLVKLQILSPFPFILYWIGRRIIPTLTLF